MAQIPDDRRRAERLDLLGGEQLAGPVVDVRQADVFGEDLPAADIALANITRPALVTVAPRLRSSRVVSSGYLPTDPVELPSLRHVRRITRAGWAADLYEAT